MEKEKWRLFGPKPWLSFIVFSGIVLVGECFKNITIPLISGYQGRALIGGCRERVTSCSGFLWGETPKQGLGTES